MRFCSLKMAVVGAKQPMPSASKKLTTNPVTKSVGAGAPAGEPARERSRSMRHHRKTKLTATSANKTSKTTMGVLIGGV